jgi:hypothetical protein
MNSISAGAAATHKALKNNKPLIDRQHLNFNIKIFNVGDSLWAVTEWPSGSRIAFRMAYAASDKLEVIEIKENANSVVFMLDSVAAAYKVTLQFPSLEEAIIRYTTKLKPKLPLLIPSWPRDILPLTKKGELQNTAGKIHVNQTGTRSGTLFMSMTKPQTGSVFYFQNLTSLSDYCTATQTSSAELVGGTWPEVGFSLPLTHNIALPPEKEVIISDAFVYLSEAIPKNNFETIKQYMEQLASLYLLLEKPKPIYHNWLNFGVKSLHGLTSHKGCWTYTGTHAYLNAYVSDYKTPPEIMVQLAVLLPLIEYLEWKNEEDAIMETLTLGLPTFYDKQLKTMVRWLPLLEKNLDESEEQKKVGVMDSWYLHHPLLNLARLARTGNKQAEKLLLNSIDYAIKVAHHFHYKWPIFYDMYTFEVIKAEAAPGKKGERDVPGSYAHLMLEVWKLTGEKRYFNEAKRAAKQLKKLGFNLFYQANNTAFAAGAMLTLYKETKEKEYLYLSYICIACILKNVQLWECNYGYAKYYPTFFAIFPLNDAPYTAAYEEQEVYAALFDYLKEAWDTIDLLPSVSMLIAELIKYVIYRAPYYYPPMLPQEVLSPEIKTGSIDPSLWIPLEDLQDGWKKSGTVGQEVYGSGICFGIIARQYFRVPGQHFVIFVDYPAYNFNVVNNNKASIQIMGDKRLSCQLLILTDQNDERPSFTITAQVGKKAQLIKPSKKSKQRLLFEINGGQLIEILWK